MWLAIDHSSLQKAEGEDNIGRRGDAIVVSLGGRDLSRGQVCRSGHAVVPRTNVLTVTAQPSRQSADVDTPRPAAISKAVVQICTSMKTATRRFVGSSIAVAPPRLKTEQGRRSGLVTRDGFPPHEVVYRSIPHERPPPQANPPRRAYAARTARRRRAGSSRLRSACRCDT